MAAAWRERGSSAWTHKTAAVGLAPVRMLKSAAIRAWTRRIKAAAKAHEVNYSTVLGAGKGVKRHRHDS
jgi:hypothetical protein